MRSDAGRVLGAALALVWLATAVAIDVLTGPTVNLGALFAVAPLITCAVLPAAATGGFALAALGLAFASASWNHTWGTPQQTARLVDAAVVSAAAVIVAWVRVRREQKYARVAALAETAQRAILPRLPARTALVATAARYEAAGQDALVGGDLYDSYHCETFSRFIIGDVRGKGVGAVEQAARVIRVFRQSAAAPAGLAAVADQMSAYLQPFLTDEEFVTALLVEFSEPRQLKLVGCGHPAPLLLTGEGASFLEPRADLPLGWGRGYETVTASWSPGDRLLMYTDGLVDARNANGDFLPLLALAPALTSASVEDALDTLLDAVRGHLPHGQLTDDLAVVLIENVGDLLPTIAGGAESTAADVKGDGTVGIAAEAVAPAPPGNVGGATGDAASAAARLGSS